MFEKQWIPEVVLVTPKRFSDDRGYFSETFRASSFEEAGITGPFIQDNHSLSRDAGVIRGLHFQIAPSPQAKLVRCTRGAIYDVAVDIRRGSPTYGKYAAAILSAENGCQLYIPVGFAHGLCTLEPDTEVQYKVTGYYDPACDKGLAWDDPEIAIDWPLGANSPILSAKDQAQPRLKDLPAYFA
ncbi:MAG: dTDP-4-dehydrorhamnose 3,5-epimerase [Hyphomonas sp.]|uniref:dTDP-4-dehydrorhamnose 3,5-epimerase n=1 Tax=Hyphomonas sp. TaxID=87 RepID=UPI001DABA7A4|nr:dTDP-4-dehydrorhamnose 3,5-epimerase [Hyphomonas sp.]MBA4226637.1 dTDP-4-dehydrorhamnose 3,5-epimerase [Hyphomonas sp.]